MNGENVCSCGHDDSLDSCCGKSVLPYRRDDGVLPPPDDFRRSALNSQRNSFAAPGEDADDWQTDPPSELDLEINPIAMRDVHSTKNQEDVRRAHLVSELRFKSVVVVERIVFRNAQIVPTKAGRVVQEPLDPIVVVAVIPGVRDEDV